MTSLPTTRERFFVSSDIFSFETQQKSTDNFLYGDVGKEWRNLRRGEAVVAKGAVEES